MANHKTNTYITANDGQKDILEITCSDTSVLYITMGNWHAELDLDNPNAQMIQHPYGEIMLTGSSSIAAIAGRILKVAGAEVVIYPSGELNFPHTWKITVE